MDAPDGEQDELLATIPIHVSSSLLPNLHLHQFPLLTRPLEVPPSARISGKRMKARAKPGYGRYEVHVPVDMRPEVWNPEKGQEYGGAREEEDAEERKLIDGDGDDKKKGKKVKSALKKSRRKESDDEEEDAEKNVKRLGEIRLKSEKVPHKGEYFVGVLKDGQLHLHPISQTHQFRPTLTYLDVLAKRTNPTVGDDDDDEDEPAAGQPAAVPKISAREIVVSARAGGGDIAAGASIGGISALRREMISNMRKEQEERWVDLEWGNAASQQSQDTFESLYSTRDEILKCTSNLGQILTDIKGLT